MSVGVNIKWHGENFKKKMRAAILDKLNRIGVHLVTRIKENISEPTFPNESPVRSLSKGKAKKSVRATMKKRKPKRGKGRKKKK